MLLIDLEDILHPRVKRQILTETNHLNHLKENPAIVWDVPLLFEIGWENKCDHIIFVSCSEKIRIERVKTYRDWDEVFYKVVQSCQKCPEYKQSHADFVINNDILIMTELRDQVKTIFQKITNCNCV